MQNIEIKRVLIENLIELQKISIITFKETFEESNSQENMETYLKNSFSINNLTQELNTKNSEFYFAKINNVIIGYLKINFNQAQTEINFNDGLEIERIYVSKDYHKKNIGQILFNKALEIAKNNNSNFIYLGVWEKNLKAINFYKKNGFIAFDKHIFILGNDKQTDIIMKLKLKN